MKAQHRPLIIGVSHHNTYGLVRCFGESGMTVDLILYDCKDSFIGHSKYVDQLWYCDKAEDAVERVRILVEKRTSLYVIFPATDTIASIMDVRYDEFLGKCKFFNCGRRGALTYHMDKAAQADEATKAGFSVPLSSLFGRDDKLVSEVFPCLIKPLASINGGKRVAICYNQKELNNCAKTFSDIEKVLLQQYIKKEEELVILGLSVQGKIIIPGYIIKCRELMGGTTYSKTAPIDELSVEIVSSCRKLVEALNYEGLFGIELIKNGDKYFFIEINLRNDATTFSLAVAGANLPLLYYQECVESKLMESACEVRNVFSIVEIVDFSNVLRFKIGLFTWLRQLKYSECKYYYDANDCLPYKIAKKNYFTHFFRGLF